LLFAYNLFEGTRIERVPLIPNITPVSPSASASTAAVPEPACEYPV
jgi:hypothetical protein